MMGIIKKHAHRRLALAGSFLKSSLAISVSALLTLTRANEPILLMGAHHRNKLRSSLRVDIDI